MKNLTLPEGWITVLDEPPVGYVKLKISTLTRRGATYQLKTLLEMIDPSEHSFMLANSTLYFDGFVYTLFINETELGSSGLADHYSLLLEVHGIVIATQFGRD